LDCKALHIYLIFVILLIIIIIIIMHDGFE